MKFRKFGITSAALFLFLLVFVAAGGCADDTGKANELVNSVNSTWSETENRNDQAIKLIETASTQQTSGQSDNARATLNQALTLVNQMKADFSTAKSKFSEAAALNISPTYRDYLNAKILAIDSSLKMWDTDTELINVWLSDIQMEKPETVQRLTALQETESRQQQAAQSASDAADRIARDNPDQIQ